ncbi:MAG: Asp-tRNA(Asn)/Glu-tRNA(Gln) amidotransferase subunit GatC [Puniceicoccales bacterium]|jgi:aspartyl-tRNA(Asn)/glutamyl-tRNA(Gln) amidotransferase subunit C|nr:Asp-tRNA(Asn)/Glu-tRNA(Gln) amidotransferase subunit GatC [Puniceicoccales bacterium]
MAENRNSGQHFDVDAIAALARIELAAGEKEMLREQLDRIVSYVNHMKDVDLDGGEQLTAFEEPCNVYDCDEVGESFDRSVAVENAPLAKDGQIAVARVVEGH